MKYFREMWRGQTGLGGTIFYGWIFPSFVLFASIIILSSFVNSDNYELMPFKIINYLSFALGKIWFIYQLFAFVLIWRNINHDWSRSIKVLLSAIPLILSVSLLVFAHFFLDFSSISTRSSYNVEDSLEFHTEYPFVGFWKSDCSQNYGIVFEKSENGYYHEFFCGKGGCSDKEEDRKTKIRNDPRFEIINQTTIKQLDNQELILQNCSTQKPGLKE